MTTQIDNQFLVDESELAYLVLNYLEEKGWNKTAGSLKREAKDLLRAGSQRFAVGTIPKPLDTIVSEYLQLTYKETQRTMLQRANPLAQSMYSLLDFTAGGPVMTVPGIGTHINNNGNVHYHQQQPQQMQMLYPQMPLPPPPPPPHNGNLAGGIDSFTMMPMGGMNGTEHHQHEYVQPVQQQQHIQQQKPPPTTPGGRHAQRKGAPKKRRRLDMEFESTHPPYLDGNTTNTSTDPLGDAEYSLFGDLSDDLRFFSGAVEPAEVMHWSTAVAETINKNDYSLSGLLEDTEYTDFLAKLVNPTVDATFRLQPFGAAPTTAAAPSTRHQAHGGVSAQAQQQQGEAPTGQIPMSPLGGSRFGKRKNTPTKTSTVRGEGGIRRRIERPAPEPPAVEDNEAERRRALADELAELAKNPKVLEDLINECVG